MSLLARLLGSRPAPPNSVVVPEDIAARLTADGTPLEAAVEAVLRSHLDAARRTEAAAEAAPGIPFWLDRQRAPAAPGSQDLGDELRDRVIQRHSAEGDS